MAETSAAQAVQYGSWSVHGLTPTIEYSLVEIARIVEVVVKGYFQFPHGGIEVGGVLFGDRVGELVRIHASRPLACAHEQGPRFVLSPADQKPLQRLLDDFQADPLLRNYRPVGWYRSRTLSDISLAPEDVEIFNRYFPHPWQVTLVLRPEVGKPTRAGYFIHEPGKLLKVDASYDPFEAGPLLEVPQAESPPMLTAASPPQTPQLTEPEPPPSYATASASEPVQPARIAVTPASPLPPRPPKLLLDLPRRRGFPWQPVLAGLGSLMLAGVAASWFVVAKWSAAAPTVGLRVVQKNGEIQAQWNPNSEPVKQARQAFIEVMDGESRTDFALEPEALRRGVWSTVLLSEDIRLRLRLETGSGPPFEERARLLSPGKRTANRNAAARPAVEVRDQVGLGVAKLRAELEVIQGQNQESAATLKDLEKRSRQLALARALRAKQAQSQKTSAPPPSPEPLSTATKPAQPPAQGSASLTASLGSGSPAPGISSEVKPPEGVSTNAQQIAQLSRSPGASQGETTSPVLPGPRDTFPVKPTPELPAPKPPAVVTPPAIEPIKSAPVTRVASTGRVIWIGNLAKNAAVTIEGRRASAGNVVGQLPGVPVRIGAYPAEFVGGGITVYSTHPKYARGNVLEQPSAQNGWNRTQFRSDARRAAEVVVVEPPGPSGNWSKMVLRAGERPLTAIMIEWERAEP